MSDIKYTVVKNDRQYYKYCDIIEELVESGLDDQDAINEYELLYVLISDWDKKHSIRRELDPIELIKVLMENNELNQTQLADIAGVGKSYMSQILNYKRRMSKKVIRRLADRFKVQQEALNRPYRLDGEKEQAFA